MPCVSMSAIATAVLPSSKTTARERIRGCPPGLLPSQVPPRPTAASGKKEPSPRPKPPRLTPYDGVMSAVAAPTRYPGPPVTTVPLGGTPIGRPCVAGPATATPAAAATDRAVRSRTTGRRFTADDFGAQPGQSCPEVPGDGSPPTARAV